MLVWLRNIVSARSKRNLKTLAGDALTDGSGALPEYVILKKRGDSFLGQGQLEEAAKCYEQAIAVNRNDAQSLLNLGFILSRQQRHQEAKDHIERAVVIDPGMADAFYILGTIAQAQGSLDTAIENFNAALTLKPDMEMAYRDLGLALFQSGNLKAAEQAVQKGLDLNPVNPDLHYYLGNLSLHRHDADQAIRCFEKTLALHPGYAEAHNNLGLALQSQSKFDAAIESHRRAIFLRPDYADAYDKIGLAFQAQGKSALAVENHQKAISINPHEPHAYSNLGLALCAQGKPSAAIECYRTALSLQPDLAEAHNNLGLALQQQGNPEAAAACFQKALALKPDLASAHNNLGLILHEKDMLDEAIDCYKNALALSPDYAEAHSNMGSALRGRGDTEQAMESYRTALAIKPDYHAAYSNLLFTMIGHPACTAAQYLAEARRFGEAALAQASPYRQWAAATESNGAARLRVGLVSGDFKHHPVSAFLIGILAHIDPAQVELIAYSTVAAEDEITARIKPYFTQWHCIAGLRDDAAASKIHADGIHVLIDLAGHTAHNRLPVFAWKPAPVQVSWLGYLASTGVPGIDYVLADRITAPPEHQAHFTETIWYLPDTVNCLTPPTERDQLLPTSPPALANDWVTFGSFQNMAKIADGALLLWGRIFQAMPQARLRLQSRQLRQASARKSILERLERAGIAAERVSLEGSIASREDYLARHGEVDIILDTFPYPGITTTCEALWMGVPTVTLSGDTLLSRQGASLLSCAGLADWVAHDEDEYVALAIKHASDLALLARLRSRLREQVIASPLFDAPRFALHLQQALHAMWKARSLP